MGSISLSNRLKDVGISRQNLKVVSKRGNIAFFALSLRFWAALVNDPLAEKVTPKIIIINNNNNK